VLIAPLILASCHAYRPILIPYTIGHQGAAAMQEMKRNDLTLHRKLSFARIICCSSSAELNNKGVDLSLEGKFPEAIALFNKARETDANEGALYNNLGIILDLTGKKSEAFDMYSKACIIDPGNAIFRNNFLTFVDFRTRAEK